MATTQEGDFTVVGQHGAKTVALSAQELGNYYATEITRRYKEISSYYNPIRYLSTAYTSHLLYSDDFSQAAWTKAATTGTANAATDPEGGTTATKLAEDNTTAAHNVSRALVIPSGVLNFGALLKAGERTFARLRINNATDGNLAIAVFNLSTGVVLSGTGTIKKLLNGWYWCYVTGTATVTNSTCFVDLTSDGSTFSYTGTTGSGIYAWKITCIPAAQTVPWPAIATTATTRAVTSIAVDPDDPLAFLVWETEPEQSTLEVGMALWSRRYGNVPATIIDYSSLAIAKPTIPNEAATTWNLNTVLAQGTPYATAVLNDTGFWASNTNVFSPFGTSSVVVDIIPATGGTFTVTYKANTTAALNWNDSNATIAAAVNALASVISDGLTFVAGNFLNNATSPRLVLSATGLATAPTMNAAGLTVSNAAAKTVYTTLGTDTSTNSFGRVGLFTAHGLAGGTSLFMATDQGTTVKESLTFTSTQWAVYDANTLTFQERYTPTPGAAVLYLAPLLRTYTPGGTILSSRITRNYYLPGITPGISTVADIPITIPNISDADIIAGVLGAGGFQAVQFEGPVRWRDGPIYITTKTEIDFDDL